MIQPSQMEFLFRALDLRMSDVCRETGISSGFLSNICAGRYNPSLELASKIESLLRETFTTRKGQTIPPEVQRIVFEMLWPPPPFDPTEPPKRGPGRPKKGEEKSAQTPPAPPVTTTPTQANVQASAVEGFQNSLRYLSDQSGPNEAAKVWKRFCTNDTPGVRERRNAFVEHCQNLPWTFKWKDGLARRQKIIKTMCQICGGRLRDRGIDEELAQRKEQACQFALPYVAAIESDGHKKGAGKPRAWMDLTDSLEPAWKISEFRQTVFNILGKEIAYSTFAKMFLKAYGQVSPVERASERFMQELLGPQPEWAGQWLQMDGSEVPITVNGGVGRARKDGVIDYPFAALTDVASLQTWLHTEGTTAEVYLWGPLLKRFFIEQRYAPIKIVTDKGGRGFRTLNTQTPGHVVQMEEGIALALAVGIEPYIHLPENPRGKGSVESGGIKSGKKSLKQALAYRFIKAALTEIKSVPPSYRTLNSEDEWRRLQVVWEEGLNGRKLKRAFDGQFTRRQVWDREEYAAKRAERALVPNWEERWKAMWTNGLCVCVEVVGQKTLYLKDSRVELSVPLPEKLANGSYAVLFPGGLRVGDDEKGDALLRGVVVEPRKGQPKYHTIECMRVKKNQLGFETDRPKAGEHPVARPETEHDQKVKAWFEGGKVVPAAAEAARAADRAVQEESETAEDIIAAGKAAAG